MRQCQAVYKRIGGAGLYDKPVESPIDQLGVDIIDRSPPKRSVEEKVLFMQVAAFLKPSDQLGKKWVACVQVTQTGVEPDDVGRFPAKGAGDRIRPVLHQAGDLFDSRLGPF